MIINRQRTAWATALSVGLLFTAGNAAAQLEEVVVTAQKRAQSAQDIPVAVTAFNDEDVRNLNMETAIDLAAHTPGLSTSNFNVPMFSIRGVGLEDFNGNNSSPVGIYLDQVFASSPAFLNGQLFDTAQVEVLKGPQGTLYGKNTTGGAITFVSNKPTEELDGYVNLKIGNFDRREAQFAIGGPLSDTLRARVAATTAFDDGGWQSNQITGNDLGKRDSFGLRLLVDWTPTDRLGFLLNVHGGQDESILSTGTAQESENIFGSIGIDGLPLAQSLTVNRENPATRHDPFRDEQGGGGNLVIEYDFDFATLTSITAYDKYKQNTITDVDGWSGISNAQWDRGIEVRQSSQELRLTSNDSGRVSWIVGANFSREEYGGEAGIPLSDFLDYALFGGPVGNTDLGLRSGGFTDVEQNIDSLGLYVHTEIDLSDTWRLTLGARYSEDDLEFESVLRDTTVGGDVFNFVPGDVFDPACPSTLTVNECVFGMNLPAGTGVLSWIFGNPVLSGQSFGGVPRDTRKEDNVSGRIALDYTPNDDWLFYGSVSTGYKGGRYFVQPVPSPAYLFYVEPEELLAYELGFKATLSDSRVQLNGSVFYYDYEDRQTVATAADPFFGPVTVLTNTPKSEMTGGELELILNPLDGLFLKAGVALLDTEFRSEPNFNGLVPFPGIVFTGSPLPQAPETSYSLVGSYEWGVGTNLVARAQADYSYTDEKISFPGDENGLSDDISELGLRFSILADDGRWEAALWGRNLTDQDNRNFTYTNVTGGTFESWQMPRTYGIELRYSFF